MERLHRLLWFVNDRVFLLTGATTAGAALYVAQPSLMVQKGIAGTYCKTPFADSYAFISHPATGAPSVYIIGSGQASPIATASIEKIIRSYTAEEMATGVMETLRFDSHELLIIHLLAMFWFTTHRPARTDLSGVC